MKNQFKSLLAIWTIALVIVSACFITAAILIDMSAFAFYVIALICFFAYILIAKKAFDSATAEKFFYNIPVLKVGHSALVILSIFAVASAFTPTPFNVIGVVLCAVVVASYSVAIVKANAAGEIVDEVGENVKNSTAFVKLLTADAASLISKADESNKPILNKVYEAVRYSDPMSSPALAGIESKISVKFEELSDALTSGSDNVKALADELVALVNERNNKCKALK